MKGTYKPIDKVSCTNKPTKTSWEERFDKEFTDVIDGMEGAMYSEGWAEEEDIGNTRKELKKFISQELSSAKEEYKMKLFEELRNELNKEKTFYGGTIYLHLTSLINKLELLSK
jgi:hypothetical protein